MKAWELFAKAYAIECRDENDAIECQCTEECRTHPDCPCLGRRAQMYRPDLHHDRGRTGDLLFDKRYLRWLTRWCHERVHATPTYDSAQYRPRPKTSNDPL